MLSVSALQRDLHEHGFKTANGNPLDWYYVAKVVRKLNREKALAVDNQKIGERSAIMKERYRVIIELPVVPMKPQGNKRARLHVVAPYIKNGTVLFPRSGCEELLGQIFNLGVESHDDLNDAMVYMLQGLVTQGLDLPKIHWTDG